MKIYAYCRVSTPGIKESQEIIEKEENHYSKKAKQDYERQRYLLGQSGLVFDEIFEEHVSGGVKGTERKEFNRMLSVLKEDDLVCFTETSRFGRNYIDCFDMLDIITQKFNVSVRFLSNGLKLKGGKKMNPYEWLTISNFFIMDEFQRRQIGFNTKNALARKKEQGVKLGRRKQITEEQENKLLELYKKGCSCEEIAEEINMSRASVARIANKNGLRRR